MASLEGMELGVHYANFTHPDWQHRLAARLTETARVADQGGASLFTVMDHWFQMENLGGPPEPMLEGYTTLGFLAGLTESVRLSLLVTGVTYRHPGLLAKTVTTLDVLSGGGRCSASAPPGTTASTSASACRSRRPASASSGSRRRCRSSRRCGASDDGAYDGPHYQLAETVLRPAAGAAAAPADPDRRQRREEDAADGRPVRRRLQPLRRLAGRRRAQARVLRGHCDTARHRLRRDREDGDRDAPTRPTTDGFLSRRWRSTPRLGVSMITLVPSGDDPVGWTTRLCEDVIPRLAEV